MIKLAGFIPDKDIMIKIVGLRPEKLYEELLNDTSKQSYHDKIMIAEEIRTNMKPSYRY
jgi:FlaA1/EpsC-like NDP-sugar epimerase